MVWDCEDTPSDLLHGQYLTKHPSSESSSTFPGAELGPQACDQPGQHHLRAADPSACSVPSASAPHGSDLPASSVSSFFPHRYFLLEI